MYGLRQSLEEEYKRLSEILKKTQDNLSDVVEGTLRISKNRNQVQYYHRIDGKTNNNGRYIPRKEEKLIHQLAQKSYDEKVLRLVQKRYGQLERLLKDYEDDEIEKLYLQESAERQALINPVEKTWEQRLNEWNQIEYVSKGFNEGTPVITTERGERVRSKTERDMANYFFHHNILYKYEKPLYLNGYGLVYPDFTFLSAKTGKEIYWEHEGMMDDPTYARNAVKKLETYSKNGILSGEQLILTFETSATILNMSEIERLAKKYLFP